MNLSPPPRTESLPSPPSLNSSSYEAWRAAAEGLLTPLAALMQQGKADIPLEGQASNHGAQADRLESFARPCLLAAHWLATVPGGSEEISRQEIADWFRHGLLIGTDSKNPEYWGPTTNHHQHTVEMAALTLALSWTGQSMNESGPWSVVSNQTGQLVLEHPELGKWDTREPDLPVVPAEEPLA